MMRRNAWLVSATIVVALSASVRADAPLDHHPAKVKV